MVVREGFWIEWFPCTETEVTDGYVAAVCGLIVGHFRVLEYRVKENCLRGFLQQPGEAGWTTIGRYFRDWALAWQGATVHVLQNVVTHWRRKPTGCATSDALAC